MQVLTINQMILTLFTAKE